MIVDVGAPNAQKTYPTLTKTAPNAGHAYRGGSTSSTAPPTKSGMSAYRMPKVGSGT
jgi:hypothetical protein